MSKAALKRQREFGGFNAGGETAKEGEEGKRQKGLFKKTKRLSPPRGGQGKREKKVGRLDDP